MLQKKRISRKGWGWGGGDTNSRVEEHNRRRLGHIRDVGKNEG